MTVQLYHGDSVDVMRGLPSASIDAVITDPPYPEIDREYGRMSEADWWDMMMGVCAETRRLLKPAGSAVFILQPNSRKVGSMRGWLWEFMAWVCRDWNMVQDAWWWNVTALPTHHTNRLVGLMRPSVKSCLWAGGADCYRNKQDVLWAETAGNAAMRLSNNNLQYKPSGYSIRAKRMGDTALERGGVTPYNVLPIPVTSHNSAGSNGHGAGTPLELAKWWTRYIVPQGGTVLDPFVGSGTMMLAAMAYDCHGIGIDKMGKYIDIARARVDGAKLPLLEAA